MKLQEISQKYQAHKGFELLKENLTNPLQQNIHLKGLNGSASAMFISEVIKSVSKNHLIILSDKEKAAYFQNDLKELFSKKNILFFPSSYKRSAIKNNSGKLDDGSIIMRTEVLNKLKSCRTCITVTYPEALLEKVTNKSELEDNTLELSVGEEVPISFIKEMLIEYDFEFVDFVYEPGQFAIRGSIVDIYSYSNDYPYRIDFFDEEIETIRTFDTVTQLSKAKFDNVSIVSDIQANSEDKNKVSIFKFISSKTNIWCDDFGYFFEVIKNVNLDSSLKKIISYKQTEEIFNKFNKIEFSNRSFYNSSQSIEFNISLQIQINKKFNILVDELIKYHQKHYTSYLISKNEAQVERLKEILQSEEIIKEAKIANAEEFLRNSFETSIGILHEGFIDHDLRINCLTEHQIYGRYHKFILRSAAYHKNKEALTIKEISNLQAGDYVVHSDHGIGRFGGLQIVDNNGNKQETIRLVYKDNDIILVNIHNLHKISKYKGKEGTQPKIHKLGSPLWQNLKQKTKSRVKDIARKLISLYAKRRQEKGFAFSPDTYLQHALETSFIYEDTPDQHKATEAIKKDMENEVPMDRLICGDVGFGKTEIAIRAAFKAVADSKQVAILVPTTILTLQHYKTFVARLKDLPCNIEFISRLKTKKQQTEILKKLAEGNIDIIIGTHRLVSKDVKFKDLGLMIVDEEQKFGVSVKEKLKAIKVNVDTLTLTATPIPRTLQFSLMGARDLSIINTAPPNRYPIHTELLRFDKDVIKEAIDYEYRRNGQVFFIHNRIDTIYEIESLINRLNPNVRTAVMHGRMEPKELEKIMTDFINEDSGVLIATTIIESGLDIPNANTIIINNAQRFGLSDLHQLRGRVGRSNKKAFCYLLAPPISTLSNQAKQRLKAIETFSELGSGFNIAMQDLDIRGAGNMLGGEQSGFISDIGYETYHRILDEAMQELRDEEFKELFEKNKKTPAEINNTNFKFVTDCHIDTDLELRLPETYIENTNERLSLYRKLDNIKETTELDELANELKDRFGKMPKASKELLNAVILRQKAMTLGIEKILLRNKKMLCYLVSDKESIFYKSDTFGAIIDFMQKHPKKSALKERKNKLTMTFQDINTINEAIAILNVIK